MKAAPFFLNLTLAWLWVLLGFVSGMVLGLFFHRENWLGGHAGFRRRMYRLAHISFLGLGTVNLLFWFTMRSLRYDDAFVGVASWAFVVGAVSMPLCCMVMAHCPKATMIFSVPVISLLLGGALTVTTLLRQSAGPPASAVAIVATRPVPALDYRLRIAQHADRTSGVAPFESQPSNPF